MKLPEPVGNYVVCNDPAMTHASFNEYISFPQGVYYFYTEAQLKQAVRDALEAAAQVAVDADCLQNSTFAGVAAAIRKLMEVL